MDTFADRLAAAEAEIASLRRALDSIQGEAMFAGFTVGALLTLLTAGGTLSAAAARSAMDNIQMLMEREQARHPGREAMFEYVRGRIEKTIELLPPLPPEEH